jgi:hypothetical protein
MMGRLKDVSRQFSKHAGVQSSRKVGLLGAHGHLPPHTNSSFEALSGMAIRKRLTR